MRHSQVIITGLFRLIMVALAAACLRGVAQDVSDTDTGAGTAPQPGVLHASEVLKSVVDQYPPYLAALIERDIAQGLLRSSRGVFDFESFARIFNNPTGFYDSTTVELGFEQFTGLWGSTVFGSYRWTDGILPDYYADRRTNPGGTPSIGFKLPLLRDGSIDKRRAGVMKARLNLELADPKIKRQHLDFIRSSLSAYFNWLRAGKAWQVSQRMLELAKARDEAIRTRVAEGLMAPVNQLENRQMILSRELATIKARRSFEAASIALSLFYRDSEEQPVRVEIDRLPSEWPPLNPGFSELLSPAWQHAIKHRPEIYALNLELEKLGIDTALYRNQLKPRLDAYVSASQSQGDRQYKDMGDLELKLGLEFRIPLQQNEARGAIQANESKAEQLGRKSSFLLDKVLADIADAHSAMSASGMNLELSRENRQVAIELREIEADRFQLGATDLLKLQIREQTAFKAEQDYHQAQYDVFRSLVNFLVAAAVDFRPSPAPGSDEVLPPPLQSLVTSLGFR